MSILGRLREAIKGKAPNRKSLSEDTKEKLREANREMDREGLKFPFKCITRIDAPMPSSLDKDLGIEKFMRVEFPPTGAIWGFTSGEDRRAFTQRYRLHIIK